VHGPPANNAATLRIQTKQTNRGQAKQAAAAIWDSNAAHLRYKYSGVANDDIDIHDDGAVDRGFAYRVNAAEDDIVFFPGSVGSVLDPSTPLKFRDTNVSGAGKWSRVLIDATINLDLEPEVHDDGDRYPPMVRPDERGWEQVERRWCEYGFTRD
jgi:3-polyprenyl-4-hydroxybenzoate decarboxylase